MPIGAFKLNGIGKFIVTAAAQVIRYKKGVRAAGNAQISTAQSKFGATSALFDGTGDHLTVDNANSNFTFGTNNFTVELWFRLSSIATSVIIWDQRTTANQSNPCIYFNSDGARIMLLESNTNRILSSAISANTWYHLAYTRSGNDHKLFLNGTQAGSTWTSSVSFGSTNPRIGANSFDGSASFNGYIDEVRVSNTARYTANFTEPSSPFINDDNTLLLLHCDGTNASTYFEDDNGVRAKKGVIANGNAQVSTAQSKFGGASALFDGTGDYLTTSNISVGSGEFTIEFFIRFTTLPAARSGTGWQMVWTGATIESYILMWSNAIQLAVNNTFGSFLFPSTMVTNTWYHIAIVRSAGDYKIFFNGTDCGAAVNDGSGGQAWSNRSGTFDWTGTGTQFIGSYSNNTGKGIIGYIDEVRVSNTARYTANFTAPTAAFVNDSNTLLLIHGNGTNASTVFLDDNGENNINIQNYGTVQISTAQSKFGGSSADVTGAANYLKTDNTINLSNADYTIEAWVYMSSDTGFLTMIDFRTAATDTGVFLGYHSSNYFYVYYNGVTTITGTTAMALNTWYHVALSRSSGVTKLFLNGTQEGSNWTDSNTYSARNAYIGSAFNAAASWTGYIDEVRISNTARYTANFTAPTTAFSYDANTLLLLHMNGTNASTVFLNDGKGRSAKGISAVGNAQVSTAQSKFGGASALFDGTGDYLTVTPKAGDLSLTHTGTWTIECWVRVASTTTQYGIISSHEPFSSPYAGWSIETTTGGKFQIYDGTAFRVFDNAISANTWYHIAFVSTAGSLKMYQDGVQQTTTVTLGTNFNNTVNDFVIGAIPTGLRSLNGYIDEVRISNVARYTGAFTPSTTQFTNDSNTLLLLHMDGTNTSTVFVDDNGKLPV